MQLVADEPFDDLIPAANLLEQYGRSSDAVDYIQARVRAVPWDADARLRLGRDLNAIAADSNVPYSVRVQAAKRGGTGGDGELALLARGHIAAAEANHSFYYEARLEAARNTSDAAARVPLLLEALAVHPDNREPLLPLFEAAERFDGNILLLADSERALTTTLDRLDIRSTPNDAASVALFRHAASRDDHRKIMTLLDHTQPAGRPAFFSIDMWSLSAVFASLREVEVRTHDDGPALRETVTYRMR